MDCKEIRTYIVEYASDGEDCTRHAEVTDHLAGCPACRDEAEEVRRVLTAGREIPVPTFAPEFWEQRLPAFRYPARTPVRLKLALSLASVLAIAALVTYQVHQRQTTRQIIATNVMTHSSVLPADETINDLVECVQDCDPDLALNALLKK